MVPPAIPGSSACTRLVETHTTEAARNRAPGDVGPSGSGPKPRPKRCDVLLALPVDARRESQMDLVERLTMWAYRCRLGCDGRMAAYGPLGSTGRKRLGLAVGVAHLHRHRGAHRPRRSRVDTWDGVPGSFPTHQQGARDPRRAVRARRTRR